MKKLFLATVAVIALAGCGQQQGTQAQVAVDTTAIIQAAADRYLSTTPENNRVVPSTWLMEKLASGQTDDIFLLDIRSEEDYAEGHIEGSVNIPFKTLAKSENLAKLPKGKQIVIICRTGHTASMSNAILNMLGYNTVTLQFGMKGWTETQAASGSSGGRPAGGK